MQTLGRQCHPPRGDAHAACRLCDAPLQSRPSLPPSAAATAAAAEAALVAAESISTHQAELAPPLDATAGPGVPSAPVAGAVEGVTHFLAECAAPAMKQLRGQLCVRLREAVDQWRSEQPQPLQAAAVETTRAFEAIAHRMELRSSGSSPVPSTPQEEDEATRDWCELILGRRHDRTTNRRWDASLLQRVQTLTQNAARVANSRRSVGRSSNADRWWSASS